MAVLACERRRRRLFDHLLVAPLHRTVALAQMHDMAVIVGEYLDLDMSRFDDRRLKQHGRGAERCQRLRARARQCRRERGLRFDQAHAAPAAARGGLDHQRKADARGFVRQGLVRLVVAVVSRYAGHLGRMHQALGLRLVAHRAHGRRRRADPDQPRVDHGFGEFRVLGQESVAGVDGFRAVRPGRADHGRDVEVGIARTRPADARRRIRETHMGGAGVGIGIDRDDAVAHAPRRAHDPQGDFAAIGDQDGIEHFGLAAHRPRAARATRFGCAAAPLRGWSPRLAIRMALNIVRIRIRAGPRRTASDAPCDGPLHRKSPDTCQAPRGCRADR